MKNKIATMKKTLLASLAFSSLLGASSSYAQLPALPIGVLGGGGIPVIGGLLDGGGIPVIGNLPGLGGGGIPVIGDLLGGGLPGFDGLGQFVNLDSTALNQMLSLDTLLIDPTKYLTAVEGVLAIVGSPSTFVPVPLAPPLVLGFVPGFEVLYTEPQNFLGYILGGGSIIDPSLVAFPSIPLLSAPLPFGGADFGGLDALALGDFGAILAPVDVLNSVFLLIP